MHSSRILCYLLYVRTWTWIVEHETPALVLEFEFEFGTDKRALLYSCCAVICDWKYERLHSTQLQSFNPFTVHAYFRCVQCIISEHFILLSHRNFFFGRKSNKIRMNYFNSLSVVHAHTKYRFKRQPIRVWAILWPNFEWYAKKYKKKLISDPCHNKTPSILYHQMQ